MYRVQYSACDQQHWTGFRSDDLGTSEALNAGFRPLLLLCRYTRTAGFTVHNVTYKDSLVWSAGRGCQDTDSIVNGSSSTESDDPGN
jgi:hypothetical protein